LHQAASATELPFVLVACVAIGGALGVGADHLLHSAPAGIFIGGAAGFAAGVREVLRRVSGGKRDGGA
jgi:F0F1-type ATP synthase assembly protein I